MGLFGNKKSGDTPKQILGMYNRSDRYHKLKSLGEGGLAEVSSCFDTHMGRVVALKELKAENKQNSFLVRSFINEVRLIGYLDHPGVVSVFDTFLLDKRHVCYTMTLVEGESLSELLDTDDMFKTGPSLSLVKSLDIFSRFCETMAYVHDRGVIHLDLKPENIMVGRYGEVLVMDWGNARLHDPKPYKEYLERTGRDQELPVSENEKRNVVLGTPLYMSPEQTNTPRNLLTPSSDIFSAGVVFYEMLTGVRPFQAGTAEQAMKKVRTHDPRPVRDLNPDVPKRLSEICDKMLAKQPFDRYRSFRDIMEDLTELRDSGQAFQLREYEEGDVIFSEGDTGEYAFTVVSGSVDIVKKTDDGEKVLATLGPGEIVGELAVFTDHSRTATARAAEKTAIRVMSAGDVNAELEKLRPWVGQMISGLSERFIGLNEKLVKLEGGGGDA